MLKPHLALGYIYEFGVYGSVAAEICTRLARPKAHSRRWIGARQRRPHHPQRRLVAGQNWPDILNISVDELFGMTQDTLLGLDIKCVETRLDVFQPDFLVRPDAHRMRQKVL